MRVKKEKTYTQKQYDNIKRQWGGAERRLEHAELYARRFRQEESALRASNVELTALNRKARVMVADLLALVCEQMSLERLNSLTKTHGLWHPESQTRFFNIACIKEGLRREAIVLLGELETANKTTILEAFGVKGSV